MIISYHTDFHSFTRRLQLVKNVNWHSSMCLRLRLWAHTIQNNIYLYTFHARADSHYCLHREKIQTKKNNKNDKFIKRYLIVYSVIISNNILNIFSKFYHKFMDGSEIWFLGFGNDCFFTLQTVEMKPKLKQRLRLYRDIIYAYARLHQIHQ